MIWLAWLAQGALLAEDIGRDSVVNWLDLALLAQNRL
jgi:hypothetical protein